MIIWTGPISWKWSHTGHGGSHIGQGRAATRLLAAATHIPSMEGVPPCKVCRDQFPNSIKSTHPPLPIYDTLVTGMLRPGVGVDGKKCKFANIEGNLEKSVWKVTQQTWRDWRGKWRNWRMGVRGPQWPCEIFQIVSKWQNLKLIHDWIQFRWAF